MSLKKTLILVVILILVGVYFFELRWQKAEHKVEKVFAFNPQEVDEIRLAKGKRTVTLKRQGKEWAVLGSIEGGLPKFLRDEKIIHNLLSVFSYGIIDVIVIGEKPTNLADYGLDLPELVFSITTKGDPSFKTLLIGNNHPTNNSCYAKVKNVPRVLLLGILYKIELEASLDLLS
jgi:hypothetical protein